MLIMSEGLYRSCAEVTGSTSVNAEIASRVLEEMRRQSTLKSVAQTVVDNLVRNHHDMFLTQRNTITKREDMTLLVRNFQYKFPFGKFLVPSMNFPQSNIDNDTNENPLTGYVSIDDPSHYLGSYDFTRETDGPPRDFFASTQNPPSNEESPSNRPQYNTTSTESSKISNPSLTQLTLDDKGRVGSYVDFGVFYTALEEATNKKTLTSSELALLNSS